MKTITKKEIIMTYTQNNITWKGIFIETYYDGYYQYGVFNKAATNIYGEYNQYMPSGFTPNSYTVWKNYAISRGATIVGETYKQYSFNTTEAKRFSIFRRKK